MPRKSKIDSSEHIDEIRTLLLDSHWNTYACSRYLELKYGLVLSPASLRSWRGRKLAALERAGKLPEAWRAPGGDATSRARLQGIRMKTSDVLPDVVKERIELIELQKQRIAIDVEHEMDMSKLFGTTQREIELQSKLLDGLRGDLQAIGVMPTPQTGSAAAVEVHVGGAGQSGAMPRAVNDGLTLGELMPGADPEATRTVVRALAVVRQPDPDD